MDDVINVLLKQEMASISAYFDRLLIIGEHQHGPDLNPTHHDFHRNWLKDVHQSFENNFIKKQFGPIEQNLEAQLVSQIRNSIELQFHFLSSVLSFNLQKHGSKLKIVRYLNMTLDYACQFHRLIDINNQLEISMPKMLSHNYSNPGPGPIMQYALDFKNLLTLSVNKDSKIIPFHLAKSELSKLLVNRGKLSMASHNWPEALCYFQKAMHAEKTHFIYSFISQCYGQLNDFERAKEYCKKAIKLNADYGDAYNDLGSYLLIEGKYIEALGWFDLAKKSKFYINREYPYINSAKAYIAIKDYDRALNEFEQASKFVPNHTEINETIKHIKSRTKPSEIFEMRDL